MTAQGTQFSGSFFFDLSSRLKLRITGNDRIRFLNGQLTNDIRKATETESIEACVLNAKGKMEAHLFVHAEGDSFVLDADPALSPILQPRLERYVIADDVTIDDLSARFAVFHVLGESTPKVATACRDILVNRFGKCGHDLWVDANARDEVAPELSRARKFCDENCAESYRIEQGIPRWGRELTNEIIPVEANLEERGIDYEKGCYIGQETISRMKMSGQRNKQLCGLLSRDNFPLATGARLLSEGKDAGWITSVARMGESQIALGYVKRGFNKSGTCLDAVGPQEPVNHVQVVALPFSKLLQP